MRRLLFALLASLPAVALAQTPPATPAPTGGNIAVEAVEVVRQKPDTVKLYMKVEARNSEASAASDEATDEAKKMTDGLAKLKLTGVTVAALPQRTVRTEVLNRNVPGGQGQGQVEYRVVKPITVTVTESDPDKFAAAAEKVQMEAFKLGLMPDLTNDNTSYNPSTGQQEKNSPFRAVYSRKGGWDELTGPALEKATKKARAKAEALAAGSGVQLGAVSSLTEVLGYNPNQYGYNPYGGVVSTAADPEDSLVDGELVRQIRVRVVFATK
jgi:uncharacterized protein YggE